MAQHLCQTQALLLASAKGSRNLGGWLVSASSRRATCCSYPSTLTSCTRWQHHPPSSGDAAQATSSWPWDAVAVRVLLTVDTVVFFKLCSVSPQPHILSILFCHRIFMVGADFALTAVQHSHFTFPPTVKN